MEPYIEIADLFRVRVAEDGSVVQPKLASKSLSGRHYVRFRNENEFGSDASALSQRIAVFRAILQPDLAYQVFLPQNKTSFAEVMRGRYPACIYMGLGYSDTVANKGERVDILNAFSWAKRFQTVVPESTLILWNAACYEIVNVCAARFDYYWQQCTASLIVSDLLGLLKQAPQIRENAAWRGDYLRAIAENLGVRTVVLNAEEHMRNGLFIECFAESLAYCRDSSSEKLVIKKCANKRRRLMSDLYTPLEVAEALYLRETHACRYKLGPTSEAAFDRIIVDLTRVDERGAYCAIWYSRVPDRPVSYLSADGISVCFRDKETDVRRKLADVRYARWLSDVVKPFGDAAVSLHQNILQLSKLINNAVANHRAREDIRRNGHGAKNRRSCNGCTARF